MTSGGTIHWDMFATAQSYKSDYKRKVEMGDVNQYYYIENNSDIFEGPFLETDSKDYGNTQALRPLFKGRGEYIGTDMLSGKGVNIVQDMADDFAGLSEKSLIISVLGQYFV